MQKYPDFLSVETNWDWYTGDAFLDFWLNSILDLSNPENQRTSKAIAGNFQSCNKIQEVIDRHLAALSPSNIILDNPQLRELLEKWERENATIFGHPLEEASLRAKLDSRAYLRVYFKKSYTGEAPIDSLELHCPPSESVVAFRNTDRVLTGFEYTYLENGEQYTEKQYLLNGLTVFETIHNGETIKEKTFSRDLDGGFTIFELNLKPLLTESIKQNQNAINFALTLLPHNLAYSGWIQETVLNGQPPGAWEFDTEGREVFKPSQSGLSSGAGISRFIQGLPLRDDRNNLTDYTDPDIRLQQPISPETFISTYRAFSQSIYEQSDQSFVLGSDLVLSGVSREQSRRDFSSKVKTDARRLGYVISDILTVCNYFLNVKQRIKAIVQPSIDTGIEGKDLVIKAQEQGLVSKRTAIEYLGFAADVQAELAEIAKEKADALADAVTLETAKQKPPAAAGGDAVTDSENQSSSEPSSPSS